MWKPTHRITFERDGEEITLDVMADGNYKGNVYESEDSDPALDLQFSSEGGWIVNGYPYYSKRNCNVKIEDIPWTKEDANEEIYQMLKNSPLVEEVQPGLFQFKDKGFVAKKRVIES